MTIWAQVVFAPSGRESSGLILRPLTLAGAFEVFRLATFFFAVFRDCAMVNSCEQG